MVLRGGITKKIVLDGGFTFYGDIGNVSKKGELVKKGAHEK